MKHIFKLLINGRVAVTKEVSGSYSYAIDYMAGYLQAMTDARDIAGDDDEIEVIYVSPDYGENKLYGQIIKRKVRA